MDDYTSPLPTPRAGVFRTTLNVFVILLSPVVNTLCYALSTPLRLRNWACKIDTTRSWPKPQSDGYQETSVQPLEPSGFYRTFWFGCRHTEMLNFPGTVTPTGCLRVLYVIPGNPGAVFFYEAYARRLWELYNRQVHVVVAGHVGHSLSANSDHKTLLGLSEQVEHHTRLVAAVTRDPATLLNPNIPFPGAGAGVTASVALAGHSVGAHICLQVLQHSDAKVKPSLAGATLLFPTFAFIGYTYNGLRGWPSLRYYQSSAYSLGLLLASLPNGLKGWFASHVIGRQLWAQSHVQKAVLSGIADPHVARSALYMADHEMHEILQPPMQFMREHQHKLAFLYAPKDGWVHDDEPQRIKAALPDVWWKISGTGRHAFVLDASEPVAEETRDALSTHLGWDVVHKN